MELDQQIPIALLERARLAPDPPSLAAIRAAAGEPHALPTPAGGPARRSRARFLAAAALLLVVATSIAVWARGDAGGRSHVISGNAATTTSAEPTVVTAPPVGLGTGWYVPGPLPGWTVEKAVAQAADGKGEAQLWLVDPSGAKVTVSIKLPTGGASQAEDAELHPLPGTTRPAYLKTYRAQSGGGAWEAVLWADWPGATLIADVLPPPDGELDEQEAVDLLDAAMSGLHEVDTETWRAFLGTVPSVDEPLVQAETLDDLPDACC